MSIARSQNFIDDVAIISHKDQAIGKFIEAADRKNFSRVIDEINYITLYGALRCTGNPFGLIKSQIDALFLTLGFNALTIDFHEVFVLNLLTRLTAPPINQHAPLFNQAIGLTTRTKT